MALYCLWVNQIVKEVIMHFKDMREVSKYTGNGKKETEKRYIKDGVYVLTPDIDTLMIDGGREYTGDMSHVHSFMKAHPDWAYAEGYETYTAFLLSKKPERLNRADHIEGSGFNYGVTAIIKNCPDRILIVAEND